MHQSTSVVCTVEELKSVTWTITKYQVKKPKLVIDRCIQTWCIVHILKHTTHEYVCMNSNRRHIHGRTHPNWDTYATTENQWYYTYKCKVNVGDKKDRSQSSTSGTLDAIFLYIIFHHLKVSMKAPIWLDTVNWKHKCLYTLKIQLHASENNCMGLPICKNEIRIAREYQIHYPLLWGSCIIPINI